MSGPPFRCPLDTRGNSCHHAFSAGPPTREFRVFRLSREVSRLPFRSGSRHPSLAGGHWRGLHGRRLPDAVTRRWWGGTQWGACGRLHSPLSRSQGLAWHVSAGPRATASHPCGGGPPASTRWPPRNSPVPVPGSTGAGWSRCHAGADRPLALFPPEVDENPPEVL